MEETAVKRRGMILKIKKKLMKGISVTETCGYDDVDPKLNCICV